MSKPARLSFLLSSQEVPRVRVRMHHAHMEDHRSEGLDADGHMPSAHAARLLRELQAVDPLRGEHPEGGEVPVHPKGTER